jgi:hypothetical protein
VRSLGPRRLTIGLALVVVLGIGLWAVWVGQGASPPDQPADTAPAAPRPAAPAALPVDLQAWKVTLPEPGKTGEAAIIEPAALAAPWFTSNPDGSLNFWAPARGATTKNSEHPRTELDSLNNFSAATSGPHTLKASLRVTQVPADSEDIILGQIHGADDLSSVPYVMLHYRAGTVRVVVKQTRNGPDSRSFPMLTGVALNQRFDFMLSDLGNGSMAFAAGFNGSTHQVTAAVPDAFHDQTVRFQVGCYQQADHPKSDQDGGRVTFYAINESSDAP